jgi:MFS family permease
MIVVFGIATVLAPSVWWMIFFQILLGMGIGGDYPISSSYVSEIMPKHLRSRMVAGVMAFQSVGSVLAALVGFLLLWSSPEISTWYWILASVVPIALVTFLLRLSIPESPKWLAEQGRIDEALVSLKKLLGAEAELDIPKEAPIATPKKVSWSDLFTPEMRRRTILTAVPWLSMDIAVYGVGIFTPIILMQLHMQGTVTGIENVFIGQRLGAIEGSVFIDLFLVVGFAIGIALMSKVPLIRMQIIGFLSMAVGLGLIATGSLYGNDMLFILPGFILFNVMMNAGPNLSTYTMPTEVFPVRLRASGHGFATGLGKTGATLGVIFFPIIQQKFGLIATLAFVGTFGLFGSIITYLFSVKPEEMIL